MTYQKWIISALSLLIHYQSYASPEELNQAQTLVFNEVAATCASHVDSSTLQAIVRTESAFNPYAIGVVRGAIKQPTNFSEAVAAAKKLDAEGKNFSMGLAQINRYNLDKYDLDYESVFDVCKNLKTGADILAECYGRAPAKQGQAALQEALSCYYSGNFRTGFGNDLKGLPSYVERVISSAQKNSPDQEIKKLTEKSSTKQAVTTVPAIDVTAKPVKVTARASTTQKGVNKTPVTIKETSNRQTNNNTAQAAWDAFGEW